MFNTDTMIDTIKNTKSSILSTFVTEQGLKKPLQAMIDAEADVARYFAKSVQDIADKFKVKG